MEQKVEACRLICEWDAKGSDDSALIKLVDLLFPCILHLENRVGEKKTCIIQKGFELHSGSVKTFDERMQEIIQTQGLGTPEAPSQWKLPTEKANGEPIAIGDVTGSNTFV